MRIILALHFLLLGAVLPAQTLTSTTSVPEQGHVEYRTHYVLVGANGFAVWGSDNVWDATGAIPDGTLSSTTYHAPSASPFAGQYAAAALCAERLPGYNWFHFTITGSLVELLGTDGDELVGGRTLCPFPLDLGGSFTDSFYFAGTTYSETITYVASGSILAPWGTIPNVVMFWNTNVYQFYSADNLLEPIGNYNPGAMGLWKVDVVTGTDEITHEQLRLWPNPAKQTLTIRSDSPGPFDLTMLDASGRVVRAQNAVQQQSTMDVAGLQRGCYALQMRSAASVTTHRVVLE